MDLRRLIDTRDLNWWLVASGVMLNFVLVAIVNGVAFIALGEDASLDAARQVILVLGTFIATLLTGFVTGWMAQVNGTTYGVISTVSVVAFQLFLPLSVLSILVAIVAILGGINGGLLSARWHNRSRQRPPS
jgi:hypothetical protein